MSHSQTGLFIRSGCYDQNEALAILETNLASPLDQAANLGRRLLDLVALRSP